MLILALRMPIVLISLRLSNANAKMVSLEMGIFAKTSKSVPLKIIRVERIRFVSKKRAGSVVAANPDLWKVMIVRDQVRFAIASISPSVPRFVSEIFGIHFKRLPLKIIGL